MTRVCQIHEEEKVLWGRHYRCKSCNKLYQNKWWKENRQTQRVRVKANNARIVLRNRLWLVEYLSKHPCVDCNETDFIVLEFDHREQSTKTENIAVLVSYSSLERLQEEVAKCDVRCANCHRRKTAKQFGYYSYLE